MYHSIVYSIVDCQRTMARRLTALSAILALVLLSAPKYSAFQPSTRRPRFPPSLLHFSTEGVGTDDAVVRKKCGYRFEGRWEQRTELSNLAIGQKLLGRKIEGRELVEGKTGPKIWFECGIGRIDGRGDWQMVNGMLRLGRRGARKSVTKKRIARMTDKVVDLYVSKVDEARGLLEVTTSLEQAGEIAGRDKKIPASSLEKGRELVGQVVKLEPFGAIVDIGANRNGLLHIQRVADLFGKYIDKEEGLVESGLERGAKIRVAILSNEKKRLFLDFTSDVKEDANAKRKQEEQAKDDKIVAEKVDKKENGDDVYASVSDGNDEAAAWGAYDAEDADAGDWAAPNDGADDWAAFAIGEEGYDEDDDIEDALGIGSY